MSRSITGAAVTLWLLGTAAGCGGSGDDCQAGCKKVYDDCKLALQDQSGNPYTKDQCLTICNQNAQTKAVITCIRKVSGCDEAAMTTCIESPSAQGPAMKHPYTPPPLCLSCHGAGTSSSAKKVPADHSGRANDACPTCHAPGS